jgi:hypothetical protein
MEGRMRGGFAKPWRLIPDFAALYPGFVLLIYTSLRCWESERWIGIVLLRKL